MRIIGGKFSGRTLAAPSGRATRPTSDRVREAIFNILSHGIDGFDIEGARVLDLFAGTGAMGLEALSRGGRHCKFVDESAEARGLVRNNADALGLIGVAKIWRRDATKLGPCAPQPPFGLVFIDPPYGKGMGATALVSLVAGGWLEAGAVIVLEEAAKADLAAPKGIHEIDRRVYGDTQVMIFRAA
jgi:16S rRNA (guanine966-N2)-methyltransferase